VIERGNRLNFTDHFANPQKTMKKILVSSFIGLAAITLLTGCVGFSLGGGSKSTTTINHYTTVGQELIDLKKAKDAGAITDAEYQTERAKILNAK
jgi:hypothetical protein